MHVRFKYAWDDSKTWLQYKNPSNITNNASIPKIFGVLKSWVYALSLRNNVSTLCCVCILQNITSLKKTLIFLNKCGFFHTGFDCKFQISHRNTHNYAIRPECSKNSVHELVAVQSTAPTDQNSQSMVWRKNLPRIARNKSSYNGEHSEAPHKTTVHN